MLYSMRYSPPAPVGAPLKAEEIRKIDALFDHSITQPDAAQRIVWVYDKISAIRVRDLTKHGIRKTPQNLPGL